MVTDLEPELERNSESFAGLMHQHGQLVDADVDPRDDNFPRISTLPAVDPDDWKNIKISDLFDFTNSAWSNQHGAFARQTFEEELELYELLDRDAEGDEDYSHQPSFDGTTEDILLS